MIFTLWPCKVTLPGSGCYYVDLSSWWWDSSIQSTSVNLTHWIVSSWQKPPLVYIMSKVKVKSLSRIWLFATPWTVAHQPPPSMGFSRREYWSGCHGLLRMIGKNKRIVSVSESGVHHFCSPVYSVYMVWPWFNNVGVSNMPLIILVPLATASNGVSANIWQKRECTYKKPKRQREILYFHQWQIRVG